MLHELWGVSIWQAGIVTIPGPVSDRHFSLHSCKVLLSPASVSSHKCDDSYSAEHFMEFSGAFSLCGFLHSFVLQTPATLVFPDFQLCFFNSETELGSSWVPSPCIMPRKCSRGSKLWQSWGLPYLFPISLPFFVWCLLSWKALFHIFCLYFCLIQV